MKNAKELTAIAIAEQTRKEEEKTKKSLEYLEKNIYPQMEKAAAKGHFQVEYYADAHIDLEIVMDELENLGYQVVRKGWKLSIHWL